MNRMNITETRFSTNIDKNNILDCPSILAILLK